MILRTGKGRADMKRHKWSEIKDRIKPETRDRIETEARILSDDLLLSQLLKNKGVDDSQSDER
jgi:hypothetical protein